MKSLEKVTANTAAVCPDSLVDLERIKDEKQRDADATARTLAVAHSGFAFAGAVAVGVFGATVAGADLPLPTLVGGLAGAPTFFLVLIWLTRGTLRRRERLAAEARRAFNAEARAQDKAAQDALLAAVRDLGRLGAQEPLALLAPSPRDHSILEVLKRGLRRM